MRRKKGVARRALERLVTRVLAVEGRASIRRKATTVATVTRKAVRAAAIAAGVAGVSVVVKEVRRRQKQ